jgi:hypothetical protein
MYLKLNVHLLMIDRCVLSEIVIDMKRTEINIIFFAVDSLKRDINKGQDCVQNIIVINLDLIDRRSCIIVGF